jgi:hypothetical protein
VVKVLSDFKEPKGLRVPKELKVLKGQKERLALKEMSVHRVPKGHKEPRELKVLKVT